MKNRIYVSIVIPVYNEEEAIVGVINDIFSVMEKTSYVYELIIVDDCSTDRTVKRVCGLKEEKLKLIKRKINRGAGASRKTGIINSSGEIIVMLDGDGTYNPEDIPRLLEYFPEYDQVNGARDREAGTMRLLRLSMKWFIRKLACYLSGTNIPDLNTGLKAFRKDIMLRYLWVIPDGFSCVTTMTLAFLCNGFAVKYVPIKYLKRIGKSKFHPIMDTYNYVKTVIRIIMYFNPLRIFVPLFLFMFSFGVIKTMYDIIFVVHKMQASDIIIIVVSVLILALGLIADLIVTQSKRNEFYPATKLRKPDIY